VNKAVVVKRLRWIVWGVAAVLVGGLLLRYESLRLPSAGCSPLAAFDPGDRLLLDAWRAPSEGDAVLFRGPEELLLGRVLPFPEGLVKVPASWASFDDDHLWIVADGPDCPAADSRSLGPIARTDVRAVVAAELPW